MEESSEALNSSNSNLRDLIMQKLAAAREQKLKQNRSTSNLSNVSKSIPSPVVTNTWEEEKQLLLSMLEKSQASASQISQERKSLDNQINQLNDQVKSLKIENKNLKNELERLWNKKPGDKAESHLIEEFKKLESLSDEREKKYKDEIFMLKEQLFLKNEARESMFRAEIAQLEEKIQGLGECLKEKEKEIEKIKKSAKTGKNATAMVPSSLLNEFKSEKEKLERNLDRTMKMSCEKEAQLSDEIVKLKTLNSQLLDFKEKKEKELKDTASNFTAEISEIKKKLFETQKKFAEEKNAWEREKINLNGIIENLKSEIKQSEAFSSFYTLKSDLQRANETIAGQNAVIEQLKEASISNLDIVPTKEKSSDLKNLVLQVQKDFFEFSSKLKSAEDLHMSELMQKNSEILALQSEISELRHKIVVFESKKYENELVIIRSDLHKSVAERAHAKRLIISYIRSVQQLEKIVYDRQDIDSIPQMYKLEVSRLNEENKSLVDSKQKQEEFFENEIKKLQGFIDEKEIGLQELQNKIDAFVKIRAKENTEEMKSWIIKNKQLQELNKRLIESLSGIEMKNSKVTNAKKNGKNNGENKNISRPVI